MAVCSKRLNLAFSIYLIVSMGLIDASTAAAAGTGKSRAHKSSIPVRCPHRVRASGTVKFSDWLFPDTLNPYQTQTSVSSEVIVSMISSPWIYDSGVRFAPIMATTIPSVKNGGISNNGKTVTVHLKKGMLWSTGQEITSADFAFGFKVDSDKLTGPLCQDPCDAISSVATRDKYTVMYHLKRVSPIFLAYGIPDFWPPRVAGAWNNDPHAAAQRLMNPTFDFETPSYPTSGPYQVASFVRDDRIVLHPMPKYNITSCGGAVKNLIFAFYSSKPAMIAAAASRQTDITQDYILPDLPELRKHTDAYRLHNDPSFILEHIEFNTDARYNGKPNPLANVKVRQALALALDKTALLRNALGVDAATARQIIAWTFLINTPRLHQAFVDRKINGQWDPLQKRYDPNTGKGSALADAKKLLSQAGYRKGFTLDLYTTSGAPFREAAVSIILSNWQKIGVTVNAIYIPGSKLFNDWDHGGTLQHGAFQFSMFSYQGGPDPDTSKYNMQTKYIDRRADVHVVLNQNLAGISNSKIDQAFDRGARTLDNRVRARAYAVAQEQVNLNAYWIPLYYRPHISTNDGKVQNYSNNAVGNAGPLWNTYDWRVKSS